MPGSFASPHYNGNAGASVATIKAEPGQLCFLDVRNENVLGAWLQLFDHANPVPGTTQPTQSYWVPPGQGRDMKFTVPLEFATAIKYACTTTKDGNVGPAVALVVNAAAT